MYVKNTCWTGYSIFKNKYSCVDIILQQIYTYGYYFRLKGLTRTAVSTQCKRCAITLNSIQAWRSSQTNEWTTERMDREKQKSPTRKKKNISSKVWPQQQQQHSYIYFLVKSCCCCCCCYFLCVKFVWFFFPIQYMLLLLLSLLYSIHGNKYYDTIIYSLNNFMWI